MLDSLAAALIDGLSDGEAIEPEIDSARGGLLAFGRFMKPDYEPAPFHTLIAAELDRFVSGEVPRMILCMPPQHGKSELVSRMLPAYILGREPDTKIITASYADELASRMNLDVQRYIDSPSYQSLFPGTRLASAATTSERRAMREGLRARRTAKFFEVVGRRGSYRSAGVGAGIAGMPADVAIIDDPVKDAEQAESEVTLEKVWTWYTGVLMTRIRPPGRVLVTMTRWHELDLVGRLIDMAGQGGEQWQVVRLPAIHEAGDALHRHAQDVREPGAALWPDRYPVDVLRVRRATQGGYQWEGLYQQRPTPPGGAVFKRAWFKIVTPEVMPGRYVPGVTRCRYWDSAATADGGDWTVGALVSRQPDGTILVEDVLRVQAGPLEVDALIRQTAALDGVEVMIREEQEPGSSGKAIVHARQRTLAGWAYRGEPVDQKKELRWRPFAAQAEAGKVALVQGPWNATFLDELQRVPGGKHDDQADAASGAFLTLAREPLSAGGVMKLKGWG